MISGAWSRIGTCFAPTERSGFGRFPRRHDARGELELIKRRRLGRNHWKGYDGMTGQATVNVNTASADELDAVSALRGHGFEIVRYREERGGFEDLRQLEEVPGLAGKADGAHAHLTVG